MPDEARATADAALVACLLAVDPALGGAVVRAAHDDAARAWVAALHRAQGGATPRPRRLPVSVTDDRLLGGVDLIATLAARRRVVSRGLLAEADGAALVIPLAERLAGTLVARVAAALDTGTVVVERDGVAERHAARFVVVALASGCRAPEDVVSPALVDRLAFDLDLDRELVALEDAHADAVAAVAAARVRLPTVDAPAATIEALCTVALAFGVASPRAAVLALRAARAHAAFAGRDVIADADVVTAARLVLAPRATMRPALPPEAQDGGDGDGPGTDPEDVNASSESLQGPSRVRPHPEPDAPGNEGEPTRDAPLADVAIAAAGGALPPGLLAADAVRDVRAPGRTGRVGASRAKARRGRSIGVRAGAPTAGRVALLQTLHAAAPWQALRAADAAAHAAAHVGVPPAPRLLVRLEDVRIHRFRERATSTTLFVVDASGSAARARLTEAKRAVEALLAESYARRDRVALVAFRGAGATLVLPPTRALARARRELAGLAAGGGTPLAAALDLAREVAAAAAREGDSVVVLLLTDGGANVARDGTGGRARAGEEAMDAARRLRGGPATTVVVDCSARGDAFTATIAAALGARRVRLPRGDAGSLRDVARDVARGTGAGAA